MGMFDYLRCEYALPDLSFQDELFQTKSLENILGNYIITADGCLILRGCGQIRDGKDVFSWQNHDSAENDEEIPFHGDVIFYTLFDSHENGDYQRIEYEARFTEGKLQYIKRLK